MEDYIVNLKDKYGELIEEMKTKRSSGPLGKIIKGIVKIAKSKGIESSKTEIRDAIIAFATTGEIKIEKRVPKILEVKFK